MAVAGTIFPDIDPTITSGTQLATILNDFKDAVRRGFYTDTGSRPANLGQAGYWIDIQNDPIWSFKLYDLTKDIEIFSVDRVTSQVSFGSLGAEVEILKQSDDALPAILNLFKRRDAGTGQTQALDVLGEINFSGRSDATNEQIITQIQSITTENTQDGSHGGELNFFVTQTGSAALVNQLTIKNNGLAGFGQTIPLDRIHAKGNSANGNIRNEVIEDSTVGPKYKLRKQRVAGSGQVVSGDIIGEIDFISTDEVGAEQTTARIQTYATETTTSSAQGTGIKIFHTKNTETALTELVKLENGKIFLNGKQYENYETTFIMEDSTITRNLTTIDGTIYNSFEIVCLAFANDNNPEQRAQKTVISGVYNDFDDTWYYGKEDTVFTPGSKLLTFSFTNAQTLTIDYVNQFTPAAFLDGDISLMIRRVAK